jgi:hypothetical protein
MKEWKQDEKTRKVYQELYNQSDPEDENSDTYITLIIKSVFINTKERTNSNAIWVQSVLEIIFDESNLSSKIISDDVDSWTDAITDTEVNNCLLIIYIVLSY